MANLFRMKNGNLDRQYMRICAVWRLMKAGRIGRARAVELLQERGVRKASATVDVWLAHPSQHRKAFEAEGLCPVDASAT